MEFSVEQIASFLHGEIVGDASIKVNNLSKIDDGKAGTLSFLANSKYNLIHESIFHLQQCFFYNFKAFCHDSPPILKEK